MNEKKIKICARNLENDTFCIEHAFSTFFPQTFTKATRSLSNMVLQLDNHKRFLCNGFDY